MQTTVFPIVETTKNRVWQYRGWKIIKTTIGTFECTRFGGTVKREGQWFRADRLELAILSIDNREARRIEVVKPGDLKC